MATVTTADGMTYSYEHTPAKWNGARKKQHPSIMIPTLNVAGLIVYE